MADYNKSVNFAVKDTLTSGDPNKIVSGAEIDTEFNNISSASTTKIDKVPAAVTGNVAKFTATGALEDTGSPGSALIPSGGIIMWSGLIASIPTGWSLCDGSNGTPDLRNRFVVGAGDQYDRNDTGGADSVTLTEAQMPSHDHSMGSAGSHDHGGTITGGNHAHDYTLWVGDQFERGGGRTGAAIPGVTRRDNGRIDQFSDPNYDFAVSGNGSHSHSIPTEGGHTHTVNNTGGGSAHENRPPYYALAFIMKL